MRKRCNASFFVGKQEYIYKLRDRAAVARQAHNLKVGGSIPSPATVNNTRLLIT